MQPNNEYRFFNFEQSSPPESLNSDGTVDLSDLDNLIEISESKAYKLPLWGSANIKVSSKGKWEYTSINFDTSG